MNNKIVEFVSDTLIDRKFVFGIGDTVKVDVQVKEGSKVRVQAFEGIVISKKGSGISKNFTVRKVSYGVAVERIFPLQCPNIKSVNVISKGKVRRAKLYYLRNRYGKNARIKRDLRHAIS